MQLQDLKDDITSSLKKGDRVRVATLRFLVAAIINHTIDRYGSDAETKMTEADILEVIKKQAKTHRESIEAFTKGGRRDLVEKEQAELTILESFLPKQISDEELKVLLAPIARAGGDFGPLMGKAMTAVRGTVDGGRVSTMLKQLLQT